LTGRPFRRTILAEPYGPAKQSQVAGSGGQMQIVGITLLIFAMCSCFCDDEDHTFALIFFFGFIGILGVMASQVGADRRIRRSLLGSGEHW
jgi:hypothetical protein